jgi:hypothetical protein
MEKVSDAPMGRIVSGIAGRMGKPVSTRADYLYIHYMVLW